MEADTGLGDSILPSSTRPVLATLTEEGDVEDESLGGEGEGGQAALTSAASGVVAAGSAAAAAKRTRVRRYNKAKADKTLGKLHNSLRHIQTFIGRN